MKRKYSSDSSLFLPQFNTIEKLKKLTYSLEIRNLKFFYDI